MSLSLLAVALAAAVPAGSGGDPDTDYQDLLLRRTLGAKDKEFCDGRLGSRSGTNKGEYDKCQVTRLFLVDIGDGADKGRFPPMTDIRYTRDKPEIDKISDKL